MVSSSVWTVDGVQRDNFQRAFGAQAKILRAAVNYLEWAIAATLQGLSNSIPTDKRVREFCEVGGDEYTV